MREFPLRFITKVIEGLAEIRKYYVSYGTWVIAILVYI